jgi:putative copper resistance protein D
MAGGDLSAAMPALPAVLRRTHFGTIWAARFVLLAVALGLAPFAARAARVASLVAALGITLTTALTGHAADWGDVTVTAAVDWAHVVSVSAWAGGVLGLALSVLGPARGWPPPVLAGVIRRFSRLAAMCLAVVVATGAYNTWIQLPGVSALWTTAYGRVLGVKLALFLVLLWWGALSRYTVVARLEPRTTRLGERLFRVGRLVVLGAPRIPRRVLSARLSSYVAREAVMVALVLGCTAVLVDTTPARHAEHGAHVVAVEPGPFRVSMDELHESGGVPKGWLFSVPPGDPTRGRAVFVRLGCFACHRIGDSSVPASSGLGPDLTDAGEHHPAGYLLESIVNPNAVIIEGPGYTGADGKSIMPDYRGQLSVGELIDLVAYLKSR